LSSVRKGVDKGSPEEASMNGMACALAKSRLSEIREHESVACIDERSLTELTEFTSFRDANVRRGVGEEHNRQRSPLGSDYLFVKSHDVLEGGCRDRIIHEKDTMGPDQVPK
jgi:hypothetical protein